MSKPDPLRVGILIVSTTAAAEPSTDSTTNLLKEVFHNNPQPAFIVADTEIVPDEASQIEHVIKRWTEAEDTRHRMNLVVTSGGTGFAETDCTPEVVSGLLHRQAPGLV